MTERKKTMKKKISAFVTSLALLTSSAAVMPGFTTSAAELPSSVDLSTNNPCFPETVFDQGSQGSCVASAITYYQYTYHARKAILEKDPDADVSGILYSPASIYSQINSGHDGGSDERKAYSVLKNRGALKLDVSPYDRFWDVSYYDKVLEENLDTPTALNYIDPYTYNYSLNDDERKLYEEVTYNGYKKYRRIGEYITKEEYDALPYDEKRFFVPVYENGDSNVKYADGIVREPQLYWHVTKPYRAIPRDSEALFNALDLRIDSYEGFGVDAEKISEDGSRIYREETDRHTKEDQFINQIKEELNKGNIVSTGGYFNYDLGKTYTDLGNGRYGYALKQNYRKVGDYSGHQFTIVGYDDTIECDIDGDDKIDETSEKGAFKIANTWGCWLNDGYIWVMYDSVRERSDTKIANKMTIKGATPDKNEFYCRVPAFEDCYTIKVSKKDIKLVSEVDVMTNNYYSVSVDNYTEDSEHILNEIPSNTHSTVVYSGPIFTDITELCGDKINGKYYTVQANNCNSWFNNDMYVKAIRLKDDKGNVVAEANLTNGDKFTNLSHEGESFQYTLNVNIQPGDLNYDGEIDEADLAKADEYFNIINYRSSDEDKSKEIKDKFSAFQLELLDVNGDGAITMGDYSLIETTVNS